MSYHLIDFNSSSLEYNFDNVIIGKKIKLDNDNSMYRIYYNMDESTESPKEIYIKLPRIRLIYSLANNKYNTIKIPIYPNWERTDKFIEFIEKFETDIYSCFQTKKMNKEFSSLISKKNNFTCIKTKLGDNYKITSNMGRTITLNDFKVNGEIEMVVRISYIWSNEKNIGLSSQLYQIKYYAPPELLEIDFIDIQPIKETKETIKPYIPIINNPSTIPSNNNETFPQIKLKMVPSVKDLQNALKSLKTVKES
jgi:hypothetical protein